MGPALLGHPERDHELFQSRTPQQRTLRAEATAAVYIPVAGNYSCCKGKEESPEMGGLWAKSSYPNTKLLLALRLYLRRKKGNL